ncbi:hypothetical protein GCM10027436_54770 [Actinophytocola sediminis]
MFGFGNVLNLALRLSAPVWVAPLVAPAVDLSSLGLLLGIRRLALAGATPAQLRPARRLLIFASAVTLTLTWPTRSSQATTARPPSTPSDRCC